MKIIWSPLAIERLSTIAAWLAADRPDAAQHLVDGMFSAVGSLSKFPHGGREVPEFQRPDVRESIYKQDRIVYRVSRKSIDILTVRHSLQLLDEHDLGDDPGLSEG